MDRQAGELPTGHGDPAGLGQCPKRLQQFAGLSIRAQTGRIQPPQLAGVAYSPLGLREGNRFGQHPLRPGWGTMANDSGNRREFGDESVEKICGGGEPGFQLIHQSHQLTTLATIRCCSSSGGIGKPGHGGWHAIGRSAAEGQH